MIQNSKLYSFLDEENLYAYHFLEGQALVHDLILARKLSPQGIGAFRDSVLSMGTFLFLLKEKEGLGLYLNNLEPAFRFNFELNFAGQFRTLLFPVEIKQFPSILKGRAKLVKTLPKQREPFTSYVELNDLTMSKFFNNLLKQSYQIPGRILLSKKVDSALLITRLPDVGGVSVKNLERESTDEYVLQNKPVIDQLLDFNYTSEVQIRDKFQENKLKFLGSKKIHFHCNCSLENMIENVAMVVAREGIDQIFDGDEVEITCDYCLKKYVIHKSRLLN